jgi:hypothetical protein
MRETLMSNEWFIPTSQALLDFRDGNKPKSSDSHKFITTSNRHHRLNSSRSISSISSSSNPIISSNANSNKIAPTTPIR